MSVSQSPSRLIAARTSLALLAVGGVAALALVVAAPASAHSTLVSSTPSAGETLTALPAEFSATFNEDLLDATGTGEGFVLQIVGPDGTHYEDGTVTIDGPTVSTNAVVGQAGAYEIDWRVVSGDGHPVEGTIPFTWAPDFSTVTPAPMPTVVPSDPVVTPVPLPAPAPEVTTTASPVDAAPAGPPGWLSGLIAAVLILGGAIAAAASRRG